MPVKEAGSGESRRETGDIGGWKRTQAKGKVLDIVRLYLKHEQLWNFVVIQFKLYFHKTPFFGNRASILGKGY